MTARRKRKVGGKRKGAGRPPKTAADKFSGMIRVPVWPAFETAIIAAAKAEGQLVTDWGRAAFELALARGSTR